MRALLFRKMEIDGINYYQNFNYLENFELDDEYADFNHRSEKDYFYMDVDDGIEIDNFDIGHIYYDNNNEFEILQDKELLVKILSIFQDKFKDFSLNVVKIKTIDELEKIICEKVLYQKSNIKDLLYQLYLNQYILRSDLPDELKKEQKSDILFHGPIGSGKKKTVEILRKNIGIPTAYISLMPSTESVAKRDFGNYLSSLENDILAQLSDKNKNTINEINKGIIFIQDNFEEMMTLFERPFYPIEYLKNLGKKVVDGKLVDFSMLTYVLLLNEYKNDKLKENQVSELMDALGFDYEVSFDKLSVQNKYDILISQNGRLNHYTRFFSEYGKTIKVSEKDLKRLIKKCSLYDDGMLSINSAIDIMIKKSLYNGISDIIIDDEMVNGLIKTMDEYSQNSVSATKKIVNNSIDEVFNEITKRVVGQDEQVRRILYTIIENRRMANKHDLEDPKQYIENILIRGESGGGKTFIINNIARLLSIPIFTADATQYTEAGYVGADITDMLAELYHAAGDDIERAEKGILVIDEIDKKAGNNGRGADVSRGAVLNGLLKIVEGSKIPVNVGTKTEPKMIIFDTSRLTIICQGAFENIEMIRDERVRKAMGKTIGFSDNKVEKFIDTKVIDKDYVEFGMMHQFMARLSVIVELNKNTKESLKNIMLNSSASATKIAKYKLEDRGFEIEYTPDFYDELALHALNLGNGVRGIKKVLQNVLTSIHIESIDPEKIEKIVFNGKVINDPNEIILIKREKQNVKKKSK